MMKRLQKRKKKLPDMSLPSNERLATLCNLLTSQIKEEQASSKYASVKSILTLVGAAGVIGLSLVSPGAAMVAKPFFDEKQRREQETWKHYNPYYLRRTIDRLHKEKIIEIKEGDGEQVVILTKNGKRRVLRYALDQLTIKKLPHWDGRWRIVLYDVKEQRKQFRDIFRSTLRNLGFFQLQESAWLYPYPCEDQITFLREYYSIGNEVLYVIAQKLEDDTPYRTYFNLT